MKKNTAPSGGFFFKSISATGFGAMRIAWGAIVLVSMLLRWPDVKFLYSNAGLIPYELGYLVFRTDYRVTLLNVITSPHAVFVLYLILLLFLVGTIVGYKTRLSTIVAGLLLFSFHECNLLPLGGGDTVLRNIGFLLMVSPGIQAISLDRLKLRWKQWRKNKVLLPALTMPVWPYRLVLWQLAWIYISTSWEKMLGTMWWEGTAVITAFHHAHFQRFPDALLNLLAPMSGLMGYSVLIFEAAWILLLIPASAWKKIHIDYHAIKRWLIVAGIAFHGGIYVTMVVGSFTPAMFAFYLGLLRDEDFAAMKRWWNKKWKGKIAVLYDGNCGHCVPTMFFLIQCDWLTRLNPVNYHEVAARKKAAPKLAFKELDRSVHIVLPNKKVVKGFDAFRKLTFHLPPLWPLVPILYLPLAAPIGRRVYARIAESRKNCNHENCKI